MDRGGIAFEFWTVDLVSPEFPKIQTESNRNLTRKPIMSNRYGKKTSRGMRNLRSAGMTGLNFTAKTVEKSAGGLFRWAATDHSGMSQMMSNMPKMGFIDSIKYTVSCFFIAIGHVFLVAFLYFILIAFGMPLLIKLLF